MKWIAGAVLAALMVGGCSSGPRNYSNENDRLRRENLALRRQVEQLTAAVDRRLAEIETLRQQAGTATGEEDVAPPRAVSLQLGRYSGPLDLDKDGRDEVLRVYVQTRDQLGRALPVAGKARAQATVIAAGREPRVLGQVELDAKTWEAAYRETLTGTHYTIDIPVAALTDADQEATVAVEVSDLATGAVLRLQAIIPLRPRGR